MPLAEVDQCGDLLDCCSIACRPTEILPGCKRHLALKARGPVEIPSAKNNVTLQHPFMRRLDSVQRSRLFAGLALEASENIAQLAGETRYVRRESLCRQGEPLRRILLVGSGCIKMTQLTAFGEEVILGLKGPGDIVGELGQGIGARNSATARALESGVALSWDATTLNSLLERHPVLQRNAIALLSEHLTCIQQQFCELATESVAPRVARAILRCVRQSGRSDACISVSHEELAQMVGTTLFTVSRLLTGWKQLGIVGTRRGAIAVYDTTALLRLAMGSSQFGRESTVRACA